MKLNFSLVPGQNLQWQQVDCDADGAVTFADEEIHWLAAVLHLTTRTEVEFSLLGGTALYCNGEELNAELIDGHFVGKTTLEPGWFTVYGRAVGSCGLLARVEDTIEAEWILQRQVPLTRFVDFASQPSVGALAIADNGKILVRRLSRREPEMSRLDVLDDKGRLLASDLGGGKARPIAFIPDTEDLLLRQSGDDGTNLIVWSAPAGPMRTVLRDEPGLGLVKISPNGRYILFASTAAYEEAEPEDGNRRYVHLRERVVDFTPVPQLHLMDLTTGARRVLTTAADKVLDDAIFSSDGQSIFHAQTLHQSDRPWFHSEIRQLDLVTGVDNVLTQFTGGWEVRPHGLAASPDGQSLLFLGPPEEVGGAHAEHNVYNKQIWLLDLTTGDYERLTKNSNLAFDVGAGLPRFDSKGRLLIQTIDKSIQKLARLNPQKDWSVGLMPLSGESLGAMAVSPSGLNLLYSASSTGNPGSLYRAETGSKSKLLENYSTDWSTNWIWSQPVDANFMSKDGVEIEAWFYPPMQHTPGSKPSFNAPAEGQAPLVVYYYAGAVPTMRGFNGTHQFFAANGYGVLVVNPRGAYGYGDEYADHHAGDWGPVAASDIVEGTNAILQQNPWLDKDAIGIYGGSYGGFMSEYLITTTDMFAAAVSMYGISDLASYWGQGTWGWTYGDMALGGATPWDNPQYFVDHSPLFQADKIHTPLLLLHGEDDDNVTPGESEQLFTALSVLDRPVEMVIFPGEGHGISGSWENRAGHRTMLLEWFDRYCKEQPEAWENRWE